MKPTRYYDPILNIWVDNSLLQNKSKGQWMIDKIKELGVDEDPPFLIGRPTGKLIKK